MALDPVRRRRASRFRSVLQNRRTHAEMVFHGHKKRTETAEVSVLFIQKTGLRLRPSSCCRGPASGGEGALFALAAEPWQSAASRASCGPRCMSVESKYSLRLCSRKGLAARANADGRDVEGHRLVGVGGAALDVAGFDVEGVKGAEGGLDRRAVGGTHAGGTIARSGSSRA